MKGVVVCPQSRAAEVGARVLEAGGTAFDAGLAAAFVQMVVDPFMCGLGGNGSSQMYRAATNENVIIDFHATAGSKVKPGMWAKDSQGRTAISRYTLFNDFRSELGYSSIMTPGEVAGLEEIHKRFATWPWQELMAPAIETARKGYPVADYMASFLQEKQQPGVPDGLSRIKASAPCSAIYLRGDGEPVHLGDIVRNPDLAATFELLAKEGLDSFYNGSLGDIVARDLDVNGSYVAPEDLAGYKARVYVPLKTTYRGMTVASNNGPGGGPVIIELLNILENFALREMEHNGPEHLYALSNAMRLVHADRNKYLGDAYFVDVCLDDVFLSKKHAAKLAEEIRKGLPLKVTSPTSLEGHTTHVVVIDEELNVFSMTHTLGTSSGVITPGLGFMYNNNMKLADPEAGGPNAMAPGKARISARCPTIVFRDGKPMLSIGAPGGSVIISSVIQSLCNAMDFGMTAVEAVSAPRIHCESNMVHIEGRVRSDTVAKLEESGMQTDHRAEGYARDFSRAQLALVRPDGSLDGGSDPRGGGGVAHSHR